MSGRQCERCRDGEAVWAEQFIGEDRPSFYRLGEHIRGFKLVRICDHCKDESANAWWTCPQCGWRGNEPAFTFGIDSAALCPCNGCGTELEAVAP